jgi:hypothetical protein
MGKLGLKRFVIWPFNPARSQQTGPGRMASKTTFDPSDLQNGAPHIEPDSSAHNNQTSWRLCLTDGVRLDGSFRQYLRHIK